MPKTTQTGRVCLVLWVLVCACARTAAADDIVLAWDPNPEPHVTGYILYVGTAPGVYSQEIDVGNTTTHRFPDAVAGTRYYFTLAARAGNVVGPTCAEISGFSNAPPAIQSPGNRTDTVGLGTTLQLQGSDPEGQSLTYTATGLPAGLTLDATTGRISGTLAASGTFAVTVHVTDGVLSAARSFVWTVQPVANEPPTLVNPGSRTHAAGTNVVMQLNASDSNNDPLTYAATGLPPGLAIATGTGRIAGVLTTAGTYAVTVTVSDGALSTSRTFSWTVTNQAPTLAAPANQTGTVGQSRVLQLQAADPNTDALTFSATGLPPGLAIAAGTGRIAGVLTTAGTYAVTVTVSDGALSASRAFLWTVSPPQTIQPQMSQPQSAGPQSAGPQSAGPQSAGPQSAGPQSSGPPPSQPPPGQMSPGQPPQGQPPQGHTSPGQPPPGQTPSQTPGEPASDQPASGEQASHEPAPDGSAEPALDEPAPGSALSALPSAQPGTTVTARRRVPGATSTGTIAVTRVRPGEGTLSMDGPRLNTGRHATSRSAAPDAGRAQHPVPDTGRAGARAMSQSDAIGVGGTVSSTGRVTMPRALPASASTGALELESATATAGALATTPSGVAERHPLDTSGGAHGSVTAPERLTPSLAGLQVVAPLHESSWAVGSEILFSVAFIGAGDADPTRGTIWSSSIDGHLGVGGTVRATLTPGIHLVSATVIAPTGVRHRARVVVTVQ